MYVYMCVCVCVCVEREREIEIDFKELAQVIVGLPSPKDKIQVRIDAAGLSAKAGNSGRIFVLLSGDRIPSLVNLSLCS